MNVRINEEAEQDLIDGFQFYEMQGQGLGDYFLNSLFAEIDSLHLYAGIHPIHFGYHRLLSKRFPYAVYYQCENGTVMIWAVLDCRQDPSKTQTRLADTFQ
ncbi:MAG TPA: hypothetical protein DIC34_00325 [Treponema sp.]|nr:hypothetical protein [Treponema sp.]